MSGGGRRETGSVSAELALAVPALVLVLALCLTGLALATDQVRAVDAARVAARAASRGEDVSRVRALALEVAPDGSQVDVDRGAATVTVRVTAPVRSGLLPGLPQAKGQARARLEPGVTGAIP